MDHLRILFIGNFKLGALALISGRFDLVEKERMIAFFDSQDIVQIIFLRFPNMRRI
jgi:hypothetical protein